MESRRVPMGLDERNGTSLLLDKRLLLGTWCGQLLAGRCLRHATPGRHEPLPSTAAFVVSWNRGDCRRTKLYSLHKNSNLMWFKRRTVDSRRVQRRLTMQAGPLTSLQQGCWFKLICGASYNELAQITPLTRDYALGGADCIDCAADAAVVQAVLDGIDEAQRCWLAQHDSKHSLDRAASVFERPWVMVSITDDEMEPHFRKARVNLDVSSPCWSCPAPCVRTCPADAISMPVAAQSNPSQLPFGIAETRCYGCGRCIPVCPYRFIETYSSKQSTEQIVNLIREYPIDAIEVHTRDPRNETFSTLWRSELGRTVRSKMKLVAISMPEPSDWSVFEYVARLVDLEDSEQIIMTDTGAACTEHASNDPRKPILLWQCDGRPMTGDLGGRGTTRATVQYAERLAAYLRSNPSLLAARGFIQCAGGTNAHTVPMLQGTRGVHGVAYGGYARRIGIEGGYEAARQLVQQVKRRRSAGGIEAADRHLIQTGD
ncbi:hypothetical protein F1559_003328 [Cyanidiococcus yangmingshanensis]|uniref:4Fe-4S ferredoxin-type domain-containing protein n=1 Tax=Cyanidiococcus yangmingshanensis TaxID=2690220 RepID=A0A7J7IIY8_9RHOD|nr:hypothetical protein F1559_003328 [Cyanidiococcus yangmingshanensis]